VVDDGSTDRTLQVIEPIWSDPRVSVTSLRKNSGLSYALNIGLELSCAPIVVQLDADDWFEPSALETILRHFRSDETLGAIYGDGFIHDSRGNIFLPVGHQLDGPTEYLEYVNWAGDKFLSVVRRGRYSY
jgi:glycosyltransferase involved in cell wall biosynthesis